MTALPPWARGTLPLYRVPPVAHVDFWERRASVEKIVEVYATILALSEQHTSNDLLTLEFRH
jgi:hypothetical protein